MRFIVTWLAATLAAIVLVGLIILGFWIGTALFSLSPVGSIVVGCALLVGFFVALADAMEDW